MGLKQLSRFFWVFLPGLFVLSSAHAEILVQRAAPPDTLEEYAVMAPPVTAQNYVPYAPNRFRTPGGAVYNISGFAVGVPVVVPNPSWYSGGAYSRSQPADRSMADRFYVNDRNLSRARAYSMDLYKQ